MSENCNHHCEGCSESCGEREAPQDFLEKPNAQSHIGRAIGIVSGKGGVGKSLVAGMLAVTMNRRGRRSAILDADITGPTVPKMFGVAQKARGCENGILPVEAKTGIGLMSVNLLLENDTDPVIWRGPIIAGTVKQFWTDVIWGDVDYLFIDMPPGTGDVPLTVFQSIPLDGIVIVTSPQELVSIIVSKAVKMARMMNIPVLGIVENLSYAVCPDCGKHIPLFGESHTDETADRFGLEVLARIPMDPKLAAVCDKGLIELFEGDWLDGAADKLESCPKK